MNVFKYEIPQNVKDVAEINKKNFLQHTNDISAEVHPKNSLYTRYIKRLIDIVVSLMVLIVTLPINLIIGVITFFDVGRPIFFAQARTGKDGKVFVLIKFRNMNNKTDENGELLAPGERVTKMGRIWRKTSLDELLNFVSILKGDMSIIGPRPLPVEYYGWMSDRHRHRNDVRPGLECPSINTNKKYETWQDRYENDVLYVEQCSFLLDIKLIYRMFSLVFFPSKHRERGNQGFFMGYDENGIAVRWENVPQKTLDEYAAMQKEKAEK